jgi:SnoaL-like polyketide cyclase
MHARASFAYGAATLVAAALWGCAPRENPKLAAFEAAERAVAGHITTFDTLDFVVFTQQQWERLHESHSQDVKVHWPDGHVTEGLAKHIEDLKALFVYAPDTRILVHPVKFGSGEWTSVIGVMEGTFTRPMPMANGKTVPPTNKAFKVTMCTVGHWKNGVMDEEYLFWDNLTYLRQIGIMP